MADTYSCLHKQVDSRFHITPTAFGCCNKMVNNPVLYCYPDGGYNQEMQEVSCDDCLSGILTFIIHVVEGKRIVKIFSC
jgi:hypothetical protein